MPAKLQNFLKIITCIDICNSHTMFKRKCIQCDTMPLRGSMTGLYIFRSIFQSTLCLDGIFLFVTFFKEILYELLLKLIYSFVSTSYRVDVNSVLDDLNRLKNYTFIMLIMFCIRIDCCASVFFKFFETDIISYVSIKSVYCFVDACCHSSLLWTRR